jgi:hypothetical protein
LRGASDFEVELELNWTWQRPARRAVERDDEAIERWVKQRWPADKKRARRQNTLIVFDCVPSWTSTLRWTC